MPFAAPKPCGKAGCIAMATKKGRCDEHQVKPWNHSKSRHERGYNNNWYKIAKRVKSRDENKCQPCLREGIHTLGVQVDHIVPKFKGGTDELSNLETICVRCHKEKTKLESMESRRG